MKYFQGAVYIFQMDSDHPSRDAIVKDLKEGGQSSNGVGQIIVITWLKMASDGTYDGRFKKWDVRKHPNSICITC